MPSTLWRDEKHDHFWIEDGELYESYRTIRGLRYRHRLSVPGMPDMDKVTESVLSVIEERYYKPRFNEEGELMENTLDSKPILRPDGSSL